MEVKIVKNLNELVSAVEKDGTDIYYLTDKNKNNNIHTMIEKCGLKGKVLLKLKLAYNVKFNGYIRKNEDKIKIKSIKDVLEKLNENEFSKVDLLVDIDEENKKNKLILADVIQQFVYLNIHMNIATPNELKMLRIKENFDKNREKFLKELKDFELKVLEYKTDSENITKEKEAIQSQIKDLDEYVEKLKNRPMKIAVMATKKTGKSVIVDSILKEEYAPTSSELATPNSVIYKPWNENYIEVKIEADKTLKGYEKEEIKTFKTPEEVRVFLYKKFKIAENDKENNLRMPDVFVKYPKKDNREYIVIDTPGPDLAGSEHSKVAYKWLKEVDVVIFGIDYSKYLTDSEEKFLRDVKKELDSQGKFHSLIVTVNKIDQRYENKENKSVVRVLDFIKSKIDNLDESFKNIIVMGTSSLQYFNMLEYAKILNENIEDMYEKDMNKLIEEIEEKEIEEDEALTIIDFVEAQIKRLKRFHKIGNPSVKEYLQHSGMPYLLQRADYIAKTKAAVEIFNNVFGKIDAEFTNIKNKFLADKIEKLQSQKQEIEKELQDIENYFEEKKKEVNSKKNIDELIKKGKDLLREKFEELSQKTINHIESNLEGYKSEIILNKEENKKIDIKEIFEKLEDILEDTINLVKIDINKEKNKLLDNMEIDIINLNDEISKYIESKKLNEKYNLDIKLADLDPSLAREDFELDTDSILGKNMIIGDFHIDVIEEELKEKEVTKTKKVRSILKPWTIFFPKIEEYIVTEIRTEKVVNEEKLNQEISELKEKLIEIVSSDIEHKIKASQQKLTKELNNFKEKLTIEFIKVIESYRNTNENIRNYLNQDKDSLNRMIEFFNTIDKEFNTLYTSWENIKDEGNKDVISK